MKNLTYTHCYAHIVQVCKNYTNYTNYIIFRTEWYWILFVLLYNSILIVLVSTYTVIEKRKYTLWKLRYYDF